MVSHTEETFIIGALRKNTISHVKHCARVYNLLLDTKVRNDQVISH